MPHVLCMPARKIRHPIARLVLMKSDNLDFHH